tara:strand:- start:2072 stop:2740 length:669 start_codon:yes stop_codon:yes gene_type:complete
MLRNVYLEGELGEVFTPHLQIDCNTTADVFKCLDANFSEFRPYFQKKHEEGTFLHIDAAGSELEYPEELLMEINEGDIIITPLPAGSKSAVKIIVGAVLIAASFMTGIPPWLATTMLVSGTMMVSMGLMELMAPDPAVDKTEPGEESYLFNGNVQSIKSGDPVPILYGRLRVPGQPCGFEIMGETASYDTFGRGLHGADGDMPAGAGISTIYNTSLFSFKEV